MLRRLLVGTGVAALALLGINGFAGGAGAETVPVETCARDFTGVPPASTVFDVPDVSYLGPGSYVSTVFLWDGTGGNSEAAAQRFDRPGPTIANTNGNSWMFAKICTVSPNELPRGEILITKVEGRGVGIFGYAYDPGSPTPLFVSATVDGVERPQPGADVASLRARGLKPPTQFWRADWKWTAAPSWSAEANDKGVLVLMDGFEPGEHQVCLNAANSDGPGTSSLGCVQVVVK